MRQECRVPNCINPRWARGVCKGHYERWLHRREGWEVISTSILPPFHREVESLVCDCEAPHRDDYGECTKCHRPKVESLSTELMTDYQKKWIESRT